MNILADKFFSTHNIYLVMNDGSIFKIDADLEHKSVDNIPTNEKYMVINKCDFDKSKDFFMNLKNPFRFSPSEVYQFMCYGLMTNAEYEQYKNDYDKELEY